MSESKRPLGGLWNPRSRRWEWWVGDKSGPIVTIDGNGVQVNAGSLAYSALAIGSLMSSDTLNVGGQGSIQNLNVPTLATLRAIVVGAQGSIQNLNVPTLATLRAINVAGVGSIASADIPTLKVGAGGGALTLRMKVTGTISLAAVGTCGVGVATMTGIGSSGIAVGDLVTVTPKAAISGVGFVGAYIPTTNVVNVYVVNPDILSAGSLPAVGIDAHISRSA